MAKKAEIQTGGASDKLKALQAAMDKIEKNFHAKGLVGGKGSNDVGDVSWVCPTSIIRTACYAAGTTGHHWLRTAQGKSSVCHKGMLLAAAIMACTAVDFLKDPQLVAQARENWLDRLGGETYPNPLPADCKPEIW